MRNGSPKAMTHRFLLSIGLLGLGCLSIGTAVSQTFLPRTGTEDLGDLDRLRLAGIRQPQGIALESTIDPELYFVGPSDVFSVNIWISPSLDFTLTVTPEGTLIVPTVGEIRIADMTLAEAKRRVVEGIRKKYLSSTEPTVTLLTPRPVVVRVTGNVLNPRSYVLAAHNRADKAIEEANQIQLPQTPQDLQRVLSSMSLRNITIRHKDGSLSAVDITKFNATKEDRWNPYLREGDLVIVPRIDLLRSVIGVYGEVNVPGRFEYVRGDSIKDALRIAQGFTSLALKDSIEFSRLSTDGQTMVSTIVDGDAILAGTMGDVALEPGDRIIVRAKADLRADYRVAVNGEVAFPGVYPITKSRSRLSEIIRKAGGFTKFASIKTSEVVRQSVRQTEIDLERLESARGGVSADDSLYYYLETNLRIRKEIVNVDFDRLFNQNDSSSDVILQDGDIVRVPSRKNTIYVFGQVVSPGHISFVRGESADYYVAKAGGFTDRARIGDVKIVKAKTRQWLSPGETNVEEGDYVWVPKEIEHPFSYYMNIVGQTASIISVAVSIVLLVIQVNK